MQDYKKRRPPRRRYGLSYLSYVEDARYQGIRSDAESLAIGKGIEGVEIALKAVAIGVGDAVNHNLDIGEETRAENLKRTLDLLDEVIVQFEV